MEHITIHYDYEKQTERDKVKTLKARLGEAGILCSTSDLAGDGFAPPTPWLQRGHAIYYAHEIDRATDLIINDQPAMEP